MGWDELGWVALYYQSASLFLYHSLLIFKAVWYL